MDIAITVVHVIACFFLIIVVLLQTGKGADIGAAFGGSSQTVFGSGGAANLLTRLTTYTAVVFMLTSLFLTWNSTRSLTISVVDDLPVEPPPLAAPAPEPITPPVAREAIPAPATQDEAPGAAAESAPGQDASTTGTPDTPASAGSEAVGSDATQEAPGEAAGGSAPEAGSTGTNGN